MKTIQTWTWVKVKENLRNNKNPLIVATTVVLVLGFLGVGLWYWIESNTEPKKAAPTASASADEIRDRIHRQAPLSVGIKSSPNNLLNTGPRKATSTVSASADLSEIRDQVRGQALLSAGIIGSLSNLVRASGELQELIANNQLVVSQRLENLATEMVSNNNTIRAEIPGIVKKEVSKAMEPFQWLLTNPPPPVAVTTLATPAGITNENTLVVNFPPPPPPQPVAATTSPQGGFTIENKNIFVVGGTTTSTTSTNMAKLPYWSRDLW